MSREWLERRVSDRRLYSTPSTEQLDGMRRAFPDFVARTVTLAERIVHHEFDVLGSGPFVSVDPDRPSRNGYAPIDWYLDPVRALRFPRGIPYKDWKLYDMRPGHADVKYPWELARCQHWTTLGQAYAFTGDERFAREIANELDDFVEANPVGVGINFTCTMDVAIRAVNWAMGFELVHSSGALDAAFWDRAYRALYETGVFTRHNLENTYEVTSNHFLSNVLGLWFLGAVFADVPDGREWLEFSRRCLEEEIAVQVLPDGADFESSIPYHRLVTEMFLGALRLGDFRGEPLSDSFRSRVRDMVAFLAAVSRPDGLMPQIGDADDGRLHVLSGYSHTSPQDPRSLFGPAGALFNEPAWQVLGGREGQWESAWWGLFVPTQRDDPSQTSSISNASRLFPDAGIAVMRSASSSYLLASNGAVGTKGFGNHKHNDLLSFEYHHSGVPLIVDPGSYVYTSDFDARNRFRSTASHNTLQVDGREQNELKPEWIFRLFESSHPEHVSFAEHERCVEYTGRHHGYERFEHPVTHERTFRLSKVDGSIRIVDVVSGNGTHELRWHFHLAPGVEAERTKSGSVRLSSGARSWQLYAPEDLNISIQPADYSPSYGVKVPCLAIDATTRATLDGTGVWEFAITE